MSLKCKLCKDGVAAAGKLLPRDCFTAFSSPQARPPPSHHFPISLVLWCFQASTATYFLVSWNRAEANDSMKVSCLHTNGLERGPDKPGDRLDSHDTCSSRQNNTHAHRFLSRLVALHRYRCVIQLERTNAGTVLFSLFPPQDLQSRQYIRLITKDYHGRWPGDFARSPLPL